MQKKKQIEKILSTFRVMLKTDFEPPSSINPPILAKYEFGSGFWVKYKLIAKD
jgi:hypothetical protein